MTQLRYVPSDNDSFELESYLEKTVGFSFNPIALGGLLSRWQLEDIKKTVPEVYNPKTMGCDALLYAVETQLEKTNP
jgi:hypothetical protein